jgi:hypothetical protein
VVDVVVDVVLIVEKGIDYFKRGIVGLFNYKIVYSTEASVEICGNLREVPRPFSV